MLSYGGAGAVWDIWPRDSREKLRAFLMRHVDEFKAEGLSGLDNILDAIHDQVQPPLATSTFLMSLFS